MRDTISIIYCMVSLCISSGSWKRGDGLHLFPMCNQNYTDVCVIVTSQHNNHLQVYPGHHLSKTGSICFWPIAWLVGCVLTWFQGVPVFDSKRTGYTRFWLSLLKHPAEDTLVPPWENREKNVCFVYKFYLWKKKHKGPFKRSVLIVFVSIL